MIFVLVGPTCSGKTTALKSLLEYGYSTVVSYTTRPKRQNEINGKDYNFITKKEFTDNLDYIVCPREFNNWFYGIDIRSLENKNENKIIILDPQGLKDLKKAVKTDKIVSIYLKASFLRRLCRGLRRKDDLKEFFRRIKADRKDFRGIKKEVNYVVRSGSKRKTVFRILRVIYRNQVRSA